MEDASLRRSGFPSPCPEQHLGEELFDLESSAHRQIITYMSHLGRAMAFAARVWDANRGRFSVTLEEAKWYSEHIDAAIEVERDLISRGNMPRRRFTIDYVEELLARPTHLCASQDPVKTIETI